MCQLNKFCRFPSLSLLRRRKSADTIESGRSMVEILGVIAIIGVLSLGGVAGFRYAMDKYIANEIVYAISQRGLDIFTIYQDKELPVVEGETDELVHAFDQWDAVLNTGHPAIITSHPEFDGFKIWVDGVSQGVCEKILDMDLLEGENVVGLQMIKVMGVQFKNDEICPAGLAQMEFVFLLDPNADFAQSGEDNCLTDDECQSQCTGQMYCDKEGGYICGCPDSINGAPQVCNPDTNMCEEARKCITGAEFRAATGACIPGDSSGSYRIISGPEPYTFENADGDSIADDFSPAELCRRSNESRWTSTGADDAETDNAMCYTGCPSGVGFVPKAGVSVSWTVWKDDEEAKRQYNNSCISCENQYDFAPQNASDCAKCGLEKYTTQVYPPSTICSHPCDDGQLKVSVAHAHGFGNQGYTCVSEPATRKDYGIPQEQKYKDICTNDWGWITQAKGRWCVMPCETGQFMKAIIWGKNWASASACYACNDPYPRQIAKVGDLDKSEINALKKQCTDCGRTVEETDDGYLVCLASSDPCGENQFLNSSNQCIDCDATSAAVIAGTASGCETKCTKTVVNADGTTSVEPSRWIVRDSGWNSFKCLKRCDDNQFQSFSSGACYDCDTEGSIQITDTSMSMEVLQLEDLCSACTIDVDGEEVHRQVLRSSETYCVLETCGDNQIKNLNGKCINCSSDAETITAATTNEDCSGCPYSSETNQGRAFYSTGDGTKRSCVKINPGVSGTCNSLGDSLGRHKYPDGDGQTFMSYGGKCYSCNETTGISTSLAQCETCTSRQYINGICYPFVGCTAGEKFWDTTQQNCTACSTTTNKVLTKAVDAGLCDACVDSEGQQNRRAMTVSEDDADFIYCVVKCDNGYWQDVNGVCWQQSALTDVAEIGTDTVSRGLCSGVGGNVLEEEDDNGIIHVYCAPKQ